MPAIGWSYFKSIGVRDHRGGGGSSGESLLVSRMWIKSHLEALQFPPRDSLPRPKMVLYFRRPGSFWVPKHRSRCASQTSPSFFSDEKEIKSSGLVTMIAAMRPGSLVKDEWQEIGSSRMICDVLLQWTGSQKHDSRPWPLLLFFWAVSPSKKCEAILRCSFWQLMVKALCFF